MSKGVSKFYSSLPEFHPIANLFPLIDGQEFDDLVADIGEYGLREPIMMDGHGRIIDGRNRARACAVLGIDPMVRYFESSDDDIAPYVISLNLRRRHLNESQRAMIAAELANLGEGRPSATAQISAVSQPDAARLLNVSRGSVQNATAVRDHGADELIDQVKSGKVAVSAAAEVARSVPKEEHATWTPEDIKREAKRLAEERAAENARKRAEIQAEKVETPKGRYDVIVIDPPWPMQKITRDVRPNQVGFDYPTMTEDELAALPLPAMAADDCHLFLWTTHKFLPMALRLLDPWGFRYCLAMVWHKPGGFQPVGLPQYNCEFAIYARRGKPSFVETKAFGVCFQAPRREHSRKPDEFYDLIRRVTSGSRIDVFSRETRDGFDQWGNQTGHFDEVA